MDQWLVNQALERLGARMSPDWIQGLADLHPSESQTRRATNALIQSREPVCPEAFRDYVADVMARDASPTKQGRKEEAMTGKDWLRQMRETLGRR